MKEIIVWTHSVRGFSLWLPGPGLCHENHGILDQVVEELHRQAVEKRKNTGGWV